MPALLARALGPLAARAPAGGRPWLRRGRVPGIRTLKTTGAAVAAYAGALAVTDDRRPVLAALTALLVVQITLYETVRTGLRRVVSVVTGVLVAVAVSTYVGLQWWSLGLVVLAALVIGKLLRLGAELLEVPISAMLVLAVGGQEAAALSRVWETLVGAAVGVVVSAVVAPPLYVQPAGAAIGELAERMAGLLREVAEGLRTEGWSHEAASRWTDGARALAGEAARADRVLARAEESLRLNPRRRRAVPVLPSLRAALTVLEHCAVAVRGLCRALADRAEAAPQRRVVDEEPRVRLADLLDRLGEAVLAFAGHAADDVTAPTAEGVELREALGRAHEARAAMLGSFVVDPARDAATWGLHGAVVANVDRLLRELDLEAGQAARQVARRALPPRRDAVRERIAARRRGPAWEPGPGAPSP